MEVNAEDILNAVKVRLEALTQAYACGDIKTFKSLAETSFISGDEEIKFPVPVLDEDYCFMYKGHKFEITNCVGASNNMLRSKDYERILTDRVIIWELVPVIDLDIEYRFVGWLYWEFDAGMKVESLALDYINTYLKQAETLTQYYKKEEENA